ncbi:MAG TPA: imidazole glycerol phosphate synthase subunit HisH [Actinomycetota bacterium]|jgi:glutamine amidotransferase|nr:imidazole glycerol phosphate synthase subunit HisH [Actinomycetota bacterium]
MPRVAVLDYGMGNLRSVARAVERVGGEPVVTDRTETAMQADGLVVPGVGAFGACVGPLRERRLDRAIFDFLDAGRPVLGVCLGMQVLFEHGEESDADGLGVLRGYVVRLPSTVKVPHMGWNEVTWTGDHPVVAGIPSGSRFYFVHSYVCVPEDDVVAAETEYGVPFVAAVAQGSLFATQFHPEKSGDAGLELYRNFVKGLT